MEPIDVENLRRVGNVVARSANAQVTPMCETFPSDRDGLADRAGLGGGARRHVAPTKTPW
jgi:hypothetical protein